MRKHGETQILGLAENPQTEALSQASWEAVCPWRPICLVSCHSGYMGCQCQECEPPGDQPLPARPASLTGSQ